jgi:hypothetical protein
VNFFGHAAVARWYSGSPTFVLGAMLPDFAAMIRSRPPRALDPVLESGVALHHETDRVFHDTLVFRELSSWAHADLARRGLARGPARAAAHVGTEILIDGVLAGEASARRAYLAALTVARALDQEIVTWHDARSPTAFAELVAQLCARGISRSHHTPDVLALRVARALASRPRLALGATDPERIADWARVARPLVQERTDALVKELREVLESAAGS